TAHRTPHTAQQHISFFPSHQIPQILIFNAPQQPRFFPFSSSLEARRCEVRRGTARRGQVRRSEARPGEARRGATRKAVARCEDDGSGVNRFCILGFLKFHFQIWDFVLVFAI
ncbi:hypothetical protein VIGAN_04282100, partial [Vigna angularis var. angularis]